MDIHSCTPQKWIEDEDAFLKLLKDELVWNKIPLLNVNELHTLQNCSLVRFRGMIQDMHGPEFYLEKFEVLDNQRQQKDIRNGKYCDAALTSEDETVLFPDGSNVTSERHSYVAISIPGINKWVWEIEEEHFKVYAEKQPSPSKPLKRTYDDTLDAANISNPSTSNDNLKKSCTGSNTETADTHLVSKDFLLNFPIPGKTDKACHLKIYKQQNDIKLNDICEFVGFLAIDPIVEAAYKECSDFENQMELETLHPPSSLIPRIHCVDFKKLKHSNPLLQENDLMNTKQFNFLRKELLIVLTQLLLGDELAAEYLIFHLISKVYSRRDFLALGKFSLNISNIPKLENLDYGKELYKFVEILIPKSHYLPMTLENMNNLNFSPKKDYECNRLTTGVLQLSNNTHVVLDETKLSPGKLDAAGIQSVKAIANAVKNQKVVYDFNYYSLDFECDIPFLILSEGKSMINSDSHVVLKPERICIDTFTEILKAARHFLKPELLKEIRKYLTLARLIKYELSNEAEELVEMEFVNMRQERNITADDLHTLLVLARLVAISQGKTSLDEECWKKACDLERERKARVRS